MLNSLPVVVAQPDKRHATEPFCVGVVLQTRSIITNERKRGE